MSVALDVPFAQQVLDTLLPLVDHGELSFDETGTAAVAVNDVVLGVRLEPDPDQVRVFGLVESGVPFDAERAGWLNDCNANRIPTGYVFWKDREVIYTLEVPADPFVPEQLLDALEIASRLVPSLAQDEEMREADGSFHD